MTVVWGDQAWVLKGGRERGRGVHRKESDERQSGSVGRSGAREEGEVREPLMGEVRHGPLAGERRCVSRARATTAPEENGWTGSRKLQHGQGK